MCVLHSSLTSLFLNIKESTCGTRKNVFHFTSKTILDVQISGHHQMSKDKTRNDILQNLGSLCHYKICLQRIEVGTTSFGK